MKRNIIQEKTFNFSLSSIDLYKKLTTQKEFVISRQLLRSSTSIGAQVEEAISGQSRKDFTAKIYIALKEARETRYWLRLLKESQEFDIQVDDLLSDIEEIILILSSITKTLREHS